MVVFMSNKSLEIVGDVILHDNMPVARITLPQGTQRFRFESAMRGDEATEGDFQAIRRRASTVAQANAITLDELDVILDAVQGV